MSNCSCARLVSYVCVGKGRQQHNIIIIIPKLHRDADARHALGMCFRALIALGYNDFIKIQDFFVNYSNSHGLSIPVKLNICIPSSPVVVLNIMVKV